MLLARVTESVASQEAININLNDDFIPTGLSPEATEALVSQFRDRKQVLKLYLVRKRLTTMPESPRLCIIVIRRKGHLEGEHAGPNFAKTVAKEINSPERFMLFCPQKHKPWIQRLSAVPGALVFEQR